MRRRALTLLLSVSFLVLPGASARADVTCVFDEAVVAVQLSAPIVPISVVRSGMEIVLLDGEDPVDCGTPAPTVATTDQIQVTDLTPGSSAFTIDLTGGPFESSGSKLAFDVALGGGSSDALLVRGSSSADHVTLAGAGIDLDASSDPGPHVALDGVERVVVEGGGGDDTLDAGDPLDPFLRVVELRGGDGADTLIGGDAGDLLVGGGGADDLLGGEGPDVLRGGAGIDALDGGGGDDLLAGGPGDDEEAGGPGNDVFDQGTGEDGADDLDGGAGELDVVAYDLRTEAVTLILDGPSVSGEAGEGDSVAGIEVALGGAGDDSLTGAGGDDSLRGGPGLDLLVGGGGDDHLAGGPGQDHLHGGAGEDTASFFGAPGPVEASLADGVAVMQGEQDTLQGIENLDGSRHADDLVGDDGPNVLKGRGGADRLVGGGGDDTLDGGDQHDDLRGGVGNDLLHGREGADLLQGGSGSDTFRGGPGRDTVTFRTSSSRVRASLAAGSATGQGADTLSGIEDLEGSSRGDRLIGNGGANVLDGGAGRDTLEGRGGADTLIGGPGKDTLLGGTGRDVFDQGRKKDGADVVRGGGGRDVVSYAKRRAPVVVTLDGRADDGGRGERDRIDRSVEDARGGRKGDLLVGSAKRNTLRGGRGNDRLRGRGGDDVVLGGPGRDVLDGGPGIDRCRGGGQVIACER